LRDGTYQTLDAEGGLYVAVRRHADGGVLIVINVSESPAEWKLPANMNVDDAPLGVVGESSGIMRFSLRIPARSGSLLGIGRDR
jgi:hypothetical protein